MEQLTKHKKVIALVRGGNVINGGEWAKDRIISSIKITMYMTYVFIK